MNDILAPGNPFAPHFTMSRTVTSPPAAGERTDPDAAFLARVLARYGVTPTAIAVALVVIALLGGAVTMPAISAPPRPLSALLLGLGVSGVLALRLLVGPARGLPWERRVTSTAYTAPAASPSQGHESGPRRDFGDAAVGLASHAGADLMPSTPAMAPVGARSVGRQVDAGHAGDPAEHGWFDGPSDEVQEAALDSFPASDPPSWSPLRVGAPA